MPCTVVHLVLHVNKSYMFSPLQWLTPAEGLKLHCQGDIYLVPPQFLECSRFLDFPKMTDVQSYAAKIMDEGKVISLPVGFYLKDCLLHTLPGN